MTNKLGLTLTPYFDDFISYYRKAEVLQDKCVLGDAAYTEVGVNDDLMTQVYIYDVVNRQFADINNVVQDVWNGTKTPKVEQAIRKNGDTYLNTLDEFNEKRHVWTRLEYMYAFLVHRITGSAASYVEDHGYRNSVVVREFWKCDTIDQMIEVVRNYEQPMYTSKGCQIPGFPKLTRADLIKSNNTYTAPGKMYLCEVAPDLLKQLEQRLQYCEKNDLKSPIRKIVDWMNGYNANKKFNRFGFQYSLFVADLSDYYDCVDGDSKVYYGTAARYSLDLLAQKQRGIKTMARHDALCEMIQEATGAKPKWVEHTLCDYKKFIYNRIPAGKMYEHLDRTKVFGNSVITFICTPSLKKSNIYYVWLRLFNF